MTSSNPPPKRDKETRMLFSPKCSKTPLHFDDISLSGRMILLFPVIILGPSAVTISFGFDSVHVLSESGVTVGSNKVYKCIFEAMRHFKIGNFRQLISQ